MTNEKQNLLLAAIIVVTTALIVSGAPLAAFANESKTEAEIEAEQEKLMLFYFISNQSSIALISDL